MFETNKQTQTGGTNNQQAGGDIHNTTVHNHTGDDVYFDLYETEKLIDDLYEISISIKSKASFTYDRMDKIEDKNKINQMVEYFESKIRNDIVYFQEFSQVLHANEDDFRERFEYIIGTIKGAILALDSQDILTPNKINKLLGIFYNQTWDWKKKQKAERLIHFMYFSCFLGRKET